MASCQLCMCWFHKKYYYDPKLIRSWNKMFTRCQAKVYTVTIIIIYRISFTMNDLFRNNYFLILRYKCYFHVSVKLVIDYDLNYVESF